MSPFTHRTVSVAFVSCSLWCLAASLPAAETGFRSIGVAKIDVTPADPIRLTGYGSRRTNSSGVEQKLWAKALALGSDAEGPALLITLDNCGIAEPTYLELVQRLARKARVKQDHIAIACSHTHSGPCTTSWAPNIFSQDIPVEHQATIDRYTRDLIDKLEQVALAALKDRRPGKLAWSQGRVTFARNRRVLSGSTVQFGDNSSAPVDHALPVLLVTDPDGKVRALVANYACHCTTLGGEFNQLHGDWAGCAQEALERESPGAIALITIGCGADANPFPRGNLEMARQHGEELAAEVKRLLSQKFTPLSAKLSTGLRHIVLPFGAQFTREQWEERARKPGIVGYHAKKFLARLDRGETLPDKLSYYVQTWNFGDDLALVFLSGEVVVDYALRLKQDFDPARLWVTAYANYVPCYIPSRRILAEGGYEAEDSLWYYDRPARLSTNAEDLIIRSVHGLMPKSFLFDKKKAEFPDPKTPPEALATFRTKRGFVVELVASEPLIESPVAIDWGADGRLWVCEMYDYPSGLGPVPDSGRKYGEPIRPPPGGFKPGGRIKVLSSSKDDGHYDKATLFLDKIPFPTGVMPWRKGALICAAPDILYAEDTDGDGRADVVRTNFTGFATHNFQARVNGFTWGLDGWLHGSSGLFGGKIRSLITGQEVDLSGRDFRFKPDTGEIEPVAGLSQMGRVRDDFDNWFGNDNSTLLWHYPLPDHYLRRNPHVTYPDPRVNVAAGVSRLPSTPNSKPGTRNEGQSLPRSAATDPNQLFPISRTLERFNDPAAASRVTSACGPCLYRDDLLGADYYGNAFICEPVHNLVTRRVLEADGVTFTAHRADDEQRSEFMASTDNWFRPVQVRTGPDGALWVVDMYRFVIEHPRWIPPDRLKQLDPRAGADLGRIYRVYPRGAELRPIRNLRKLEGNDLAKVLDTPNGPARDLLHQEMSTHHLAGNAPAMWPGVMQSSNPAVRVQALAILKTVDSVSNSPILKHAFSDVHPLVRRQAVQLTEPYLNAIPELGQELIVMAEAENLAQAQLQPGPRFERDPRLRFQLTLSLGEWSDPRAAEALARFARVDHAWLQAALLSSAVHNPGLILKRLIEVESPGPALDGLGAQLIRMAVAVDDRGGLNRALQRIARFHTLGMPETAHTLLVAAFLDAVEARNVYWKEYVRFTDGAQGQTKELQALDGDATVVSVQSCLDLAQEVLTNSATRWSEPNDGFRDGLGACVLLMGRDPTRIEEAVTVLSDWLTQSPPPYFQAAVVERLRRLRSPSVSRLLLERWPVFSTSLRPQLIGVMVSREEWTSELLRGMQEGVVSIHEIPLAIRQQLLKHKNIAIQNQAAKLFQANNARSAVLANYQMAATIPGHTENGAAVFDKNCAQCHALRGHGHAVGPNLLEFAGKSMQDFLVAILDPNAAINPNFLAYNIETKDGRSLTGVVRGETASGLTLVQGGGVEEKILRSEVKEIRASQLSLMPEGLEQGMTPQDVADLVAWLKKSAPAPFGTASADAGRAAKAREEFLKGGAIGIAEVMTAAERLPYRSWIGTFPMAYCRQSAGANKLVWQTRPVSLPALAPRPFTPALSPDGGEGGGSAGREQTVTFRLPAAMGFSSQPEGRFTLRLNTKPALDFGVALSDQTWQSADGKIRMAYTVMENNSEDSNGVLLIEVSASLLESGKPATFEVTGSASNSQRWFGVYLVSP